MGLVLGPYAHTNRTRDARVAEPRPPGLEDGRSGEGKRLTPDAPHNAGRPLPPGDGPPHHRGTQPPQCMQAKGTVLGPHTRTPAPTARGRRTPTARIEGGQPGEGKRLNSNAPHNGERHPPKGRPSATPTARINRSQGVGPVLGPHAHTNQTRDARVAKPRLPNPEDGWQGEGQRLTPDAPRNGGRPPPPGNGPQPAPRHAAPHRACEPREQCWAPTLAHPRPLHAGSGPRQPARKAGSRGRGSAGTQTLLATAKGTPSGDAPPPPPQCATEARKGTTLWGRCWDRHHPRSTQPPQGIQAKGTVLGLYTRTPAPTACG